MSSKFIKIKNFISIKEDKNHCLFLYKIYFIIKQDIELRLLHNKQDIINLLYNNF